MEELKKLEDGLAGCDAEPESATSTTDTWKSFGGITQHNSETEIRCDAEGLWAMLGMHSMAATYTALTRQCARTQKVQFLEPKLQNSSPCFAKQTSRA